jgi:hypothetical protein
VHVVAVVKTLVLTVPSVKLAWGRGREKLVIPTREEEAGSPGGSEHEHAKMRESIMFMLLTEISDAAQGQKSLA